MRIYSLVCLALVAGSTLSAQDASRSLPQLPPDPRAMFSAAAPLYDFDDPALKPWHLKGTYQLYENGQPGEQGTYEYWWISPKVFHSSWTRPGATRTEWHTADGKAVFEATGERLFYLEHDLESALFSPLPNAAELDPAIAALDHEKLKFSKLELPCAIVMKRKRPDGTPISPDLNSGDRYCFDPSAPVLRIKRDSQFLFTAYDQLARTQNRILARELTVSDGDHRLLMLTVSTVENLAANDAALTPSDTATPFTPSPRRPFTSKNKGGALAKKWPPVYPLAAKTAQIQGTVLLDAMIGTDGSVRDICVLSSPSPLLTDASKDCVARWQYSPYIIDGQPQEVNSLIRVIFSLGN
jgi:TonB family protein